MQSPSVASNHKARNDALQYYGNGKIACVRCGFEDIRALSIDHINGRGNIGRSDSIRGGTGLYYWLRRNDYPKRFQTLCRNCQAIKQWENKEFNNGAHYNPLKVCSPALEYKEDKPRIRKQIHATSTSEDKEIMRQLILEYFNEHPELLNGDINHARSEAIRQLSSALDINETYIRRWMVDANMVKPRIYKFDGSQYYYIYEHLDELLEKYNNCKKYKAPEITGLSRYGINIMLYLAGMPEKCSTGDLDSITYKSKLLKIPVRTK